MCDGDWILLYNSSIRWGLYVHENEHEVAEGDRFSFTALYLAVKTQSPTETSVSLEPLECRSTLAEGHLARIASKSPADRNTLLLLSSSFVVCVSICEGESAKWREEDREKRREKKTGGGRGEGNLELE